MKRFQARIGNGRFTPNTTENCFGLRTIICACGAINAYGRKPVEPSPFIDPLLFNTWDVPTRCHACGAELAEQGRQG